MYLSRVVQRYTQSPVQSTYGANTYHESTIPTCTSLLKIIANEIIIVQLQKTTEPSNSGFAYKTK